MKDPDMLTAINRLMAARDELLVGFVDSSIRDGQIARARADFEAAAEAMGYSVARIEQVAA